MNFIYMQLAAIAGNEWWNPNFFREQFIGESVKYDVSKCAIVSNIYCKYSVSKKI